MLTKMILTRNVTQYICACLVSCFFGAIWLPVASAQFRQDKVHYWEQIDPDKNVFDMPRPKRKPTEAELALLGSSAAESRQNIARIICRYHENVPEDERGPIAERLIAKLTEGEPVPQVRNSLISAAILLSGPEHAKTLWELAKSEDAVRPRVERTLIQWKSPVAIDTWRANARAENTSTQELLLAIEGLYAVGNSEDIASLQKILMHHRYSSAVKIQAARSLGNIQADGLNDLAQQVLASDADHRDIIAAHLLCQHRGDRTALQLQQILEKGSPTGQGIALEALLPWNIDATKQYAKLLISHSDDKLRILSLQILNKLNEPENLLLIGATLDDKHPEVRKLATQYLKESAAQDRKEVVEGIANKYLGSEHWQGVEQAIELSVHLKSTSACPRFIELLEHDQPEVNMTAAWGLRELGNTPEIWRASSIHASKVTERILTGGGYQRTDHIRVSYLFEGMGKSDFNEGVELLMKYVPKNYAMGAPSRCSAIWALGILNRNKDNLELRQKLHARILDFSPMEPEMSLVRYGCILACGELGHTAGFEESLKIFKPFQADIVNPIRSAADWAEKQIMERSGSPAN